MATILGTEGDDILFGTKKKDYFDGLEGSDTFVIGLNSGFDSFADSGTVGWDRIIAEESGVIIKIGSSFGPESGIEEISAEGFANVSIGGSTIPDDFDFSETYLAQITKITGGPGSDTIVGSSGDDDIRGNNDSDRIYGGNGDDKLFGGDLNDLDPIQDARHGEDGNDILYGGEGNDLLAGGAGNDSLSGDEGDDQLFGGAGLDDIAGGLGADTFFYSAIAEGGDLIADFDRANDTIDLSRIDANTLSLRNNAFAFVGPTAEVRPNAVSYVIDGDRTIISADVNGDSTADFVLTLIGAMELSADNFFL